MPLSFKIFSLTPPLCRPPSPGAGIFSINIPRWVETSIAATVIVLLCLVLSGCLRSGSTEAEPKLGILVHMVVCLEKLPGEGDREGAGQSPGELWSVSGSIGLSPLRWGWAFVPSQVGDWPFSYQPHPCGVDLTSQAVLHRRLHLWAANSHTCTAVGVHAWVTCPVTGIWTSTSSMYYIRWP